jgi:hypothetical protein
MAMLMMQLTDDNKTSGASFSAGKVGAQEARKLA